ncbi:MAG: hypothetical protein OXG55_14090 [bacterium]|nr:hypothetical protein [bacterium]
METIIAALIGLVGVALGVLAFWIRAGFSDLRSAMAEGFAAAERRVDERFNKVDERFDKVEVILREHGERIARMEGALAASGVALPLPATAAERPVLEPPAAEAAAG